VASGELVYTCVKLFIGTLCSFLAIVLWARSMDGAWFFIVFGVLAAYANILFSVLARFGLTEWADYSIGGVQVAALALECLPLLFFCIAFLVIIFRRVK
jgi:hypothetical protein